ncbi:MAG: phospholipase D family protein [Bauldia sp.]
MRIRSAVASLVALAVSTVAVAEGAATAPDIAVCFTPGEDCTGKIVAEIDAAKSSLLIQAFSFTSTPLMKAIDSAHKRGVAVRIIMDRTNETQDHVAATFFAQRGMVPLIDDKVEIAHNKVMVIDGRVVITGSFNFTTAAQKANAENVLIVKNDPALAKAYEANWQKRAAASRLYGGRWRGF